MPRQLTSRLLLTLLFFQAALAAPPAAFAGAEFQLVSWERTEKNDRAQVAVQFRTDSSRQGAFAAEPIFLDDFHAREAGASVAYSMPQESPRRSFLLAVPGLDQSRESGGWKASAPCGDCVSAKAVRVAGVDALQVTVDASKAKDPAFEILLSGPASAGKSNSETEESPDWVRALFLNPDDAGMTGTAGKGGASNPAPPDPPGDTRVAYVEGDRVLRVSLASLGLSPGDLGTAAFVHHGDVLPYGGVLGGDVWLYAPRRVTLSDKRDAIFADVTPAAPSPAMLEIPAFDTLTAANVEVEQERSRLFEDNSGRYERFLDAPAGERFGFFRIQNPANSTWKATETISLDISDELTTPELTYEILAYGVNQTVGVSPDHENEFTVAGEVLPLLRWEGQNAATLTGTVALASPPTPSGSISFVTRVLAPATNIDIQVLDKITLGWTGYPRLNQAGLGELDLPAAGAPRLVTISGIPAGTAAADIYLLDVTDSKTPRRLTGFNLFTDGSGLGTLAAEFEAPAAPSRFFIQTVSTFETPSEIVPARSLPAPLPVTEKLRRIYVRDDALAASLAPLVTLRGEGTLAFDPEAAYDVYGGGQQSPEAIRQALAHYITTAADRLPLPVVLLVGHGSYDRRDYLGLQSGFQIPPFVEEGSLTTLGTVEDSVDLRFGLLEGADDLMDAQVGRLPVKTAPQLDIVVDRLLDYEALVPALREEDRLGLIVLDNNDGAGDFQGDGPYWIAQWETTGRPSQLLTLETQSTTAVRNGIDSAMEGADGGVNFAFYVGHGNFNTWAGEQILTQTLIDNIDTQNKWPIVATFTCLNHFFAFPGLPSLSLGEAWMLATPNRGAVASIAPCGFDAYSSHLPLAIGMVDQFALAPGARPKRIGESHTRNMIQYALDYPSESRLKVARSYLLFGDPEVDWTIDPPNAGLQSHWMVLGE
ncbi:MAG: C25 family cysteine peptidase [Sumerlaeia bacterium]